MSARRKLSRKSLLVAAAAGAILTMATGAAQAAGPCPTITAPYDGATVGATGDVRGAASLEPGQSLWVFVHPRNYYQWWPQQGPAEVLDGRWSVHVNYGGSGDRGVDFEIAATVVDARTNAYLQAWWSKARASGVYPPVELPLGLDNCDAWLTTVAKAN